VFGISSQIGRDGHGGMGDVSTYGKNIRNLLGSMKPPGSNPTFVQILGDTSISEHLWE